MKLLQLRIRDFLGITRASLDLSRPLNLIQGQNGAGKSSIRDAALWALTGRCRGTDAAGRGAAALIHTGQQEAAVGLTFRTADGLDYTTIREQNGTMSRFQLTCPDGAVISGRAAQDRLEAVIGAGVDLVEICLDPLRFLDLEARAQGSLLAGAVGLRLARPELLGHARAYRLSEGATQALDVELGLTPGYSDGRAIVGPIEFQTIYQVIYARRRELKKEAAAIADELKALPGGKIPSAGGLEAARANEKALGEQEAKLREQVGALQARMAAHARMLARKVQLEEETAALEARAQQPPGDLFTGASSVATFEAEVERLQEAHRLAASTEVGFQETRIHTEAQAKAAWERVVQARDGDASCPAHVTDDPCPLLLPRVQERKAKVPELTAVVKKLEAAAGKARTAEKAASEQAEQARTNLANGEESLRLAREAAARSQGQGAAEWDAIQAELDRISEALASEGNPTAELVRTEQALREIAHGREAARWGLAEDERLVQSASERKRIEERLAAKEAAIEIAEELTKGLDPQALPARILMAKVGPVEEGINQVLGDITEEQYRISIEADGGGVVFSVYKSGSEHPLVLALLSKSERLRVGAALAASFALITPFRCVCVDEADTLTMGNRAALFGALDGLPLETAILIASSELSTAEIEEGLGVFWVENGTVRMLEEGVPA